MISRYYNARKLMVQRQLVDNGITGRRLLKAFLKVPRHEFIPESLRAEAYFDKPLPIGYGQTISQPYMVAIMTQLAAVQPTDRVLEIGTGSGYQGAILAELAQKVYTIERIAELASRAEKTLARLHYANILVRVADGTLGWDTEGPFHVILVGAGAPKVPGPLLDQLTTNGRLLIPIEEGGSQMLYKIRRSDAGFLKECQERCLFVPLIGKHGWRKDPRASWLPKGVNSTSA